MRRVGHGRDEGGDDLEVLVAELVHDGVGAVAERAKEGETGSPALVGVAEVDDAVVGGVVAGAADVAGPLEPVDDQAGPCNASETRLSGLTW